MSWPWNTGTAIPAAIALVAVQSSGTPVLAQTQPTAVAQQSLAPRIGVAEAPLSLTLADAVRMTLEQNNDVTIARLDTDVARQNVRVFEGRATTRGSCRTSDTSGTSAPTRRPLAARQRGGSNGPRSTAAPA